MHEGIPCWCYGQVFFKDFLYNNFLRKNLIESCNWKYLDVSLEIKMLIKIIVIP